MIVSFKLGVVVVKLEPYEFLPVTKMPAEMSVSPPRCVKLLGESQT